MIVLTVAAVAVCLLALATWGYWPWRDKPQVAVPPPTASPRQVVQAYLHALDAHDSATAEALSTPGFRATTDARGVLVHQSLVEAGPSFPDGQEGWGYQLVRSHGRYLIDDDGVG